ncbi:MAG TPA: hypothetical protein VIU39_13890 [Anaerolineales bacterium]
MNHQPFETWLLEEQRLSLEDKRELDAHLRECTRCTSLAETGLALHSARMAAPAPGFTVRFQQRLEAHRLAERRRRFFGVILFAVSGLGLAGWLAAPLAAQIAASPLQWISLLFGYFLFIKTSMQALIEVGAVLLRVAPGFMPAYFWMVLASGAAGAALLWAVSLWRLTRVPRGA